MTLLDASSELVPRDVPRRFEGSGAFVGPVMEPWPRPPLHRSPCSKTGKRDGLGKSHTASVVCAWVGNLTSIHGPLCVQIATAMPAPSVRDHGHASARAISPLRNQDISQGGPMRGGEGLNSVVYASTALRSTRGAAHGKGKPAGQRAMPMVPSAHRHTLVRRPILSQAFGKLGS